MSGKIDKSFSSVPKKANKETAPEASLRSRSIGNDFQSMLESQLRKNEQNVQEEVHFSRHAMERVEQRGIQVTNDLLDELSGAIARARAKGSKDCVIIDSNEAFIVNIPNNTVITAVSGDEMKENIFTNIDSAVII